MQKIFIHCFLIAGSPRYRIDASWRGRINKQLAVILGKHKHKVHLVYCMTDQLHVVVRLGAEESIEEFCHRLRNCSLKMINKVVQQNGRFFWSPGYVAVSICGDAVSTEIKKIYALDSLGSDDFNTPFIEEP